MERAFQKRSTQNWWTDFDNSISYFDFDRPMDAINGTPTPLSGRVALVTGGSRGIGAAIARRLAGAGADVAITYRSSSDAAEALVAELRDAFGVRAEAIQSDASDVEATAGLVPGVVDRLGRLDVLVNNAGVFGPKPIHETTLEDYEHTMGVNVRAVFQTSKAAAEVMGEGGRIINIGSINGQHAMGPGMSLYATSKAAVATLTKGLARDLGPQGVTVNCIQPGPVDTDMNPADGELAEMITPMTALGRYARPDEIASLALYLASPESSYVTGALLNIDGGVEA